MPEKSSLDLFCWANAGPFELVRVFVSADEGVCSSMHIVWVLAGKQQALVYA